MKKSEDTQQLEYVIGKVNNLNTEHFSLFVQIQQ